MSAHPDAQGADNPYVIQVHELVSALDQQVSVVITNANTTDTLMKNWGDLMQAAHDALTTGAVNIQKAESDLSADISKMNEAISVLNETIRRKTSRSQHPQAASASDCFSSSWVSRWRPRRGEPAFSSPEPGGCSSSEAQ